MFGWLRIAGHRGWQLGGVAVGAFVLWTAFQRLQLLVVTAFVGLLLAALLVPVARWLERAGVPRGPAAALAVVGGTVVLVVVLVLLGLRLAGQVPELAEEAGQVVDRATRWLERGPLDVTEAPFGDAVDRVVQFLQARWAELANQALALVKAVGGLVTALVLAFFLIRDADTIAAWMLERLVTDEQRAIARAAGSRSVETLQGYIQATVVIGALDAVLIGGALLVLGVPLAVPLAVLTFFGGFFPVAGATVAGFLASLVALVDGGLGRALVVLAVVIVVQQVDGNVLQPAIMGRAVHLHPVVVLGALGTGALLAGVIGAFLAVPTTAVLVAVGAELRERRDEQALGAKAADSTR